MSAKFLKICAYIMPLIFIGQVVVTVVLINLSQERCEAIGARFVEIVKEKKTCRFVRQ